MSQYGLFGKMCLPIAFKCIPRFNRKKFVEAVEFALTQTENHANFYPLICEKFLDAGTVLVLLPNLEGSKTNGATKKIGNKVMIMVNDRRMNSDTFWFTLLHEIGHVINEDYGISFENETGDAEDAADEYAQNKLIDPALYNAFVKQHFGRFTTESVLMFARDINRDPGIVLGRLEHDGYVSHANGLQSLRCKYHVSMK